MSKQDETPTEFFDQEPFQDPLEEVSDGDDLDDEETAEEEEEEELDDDTEALSEINPIKGLYIFIKWKLGMDIGEYERLLVGGEDVSLQEQQKDLISPTSADFSDPTMAQIGQDWSISTFTSQFPSEPNDLFLKRVFEQPKVRSDFTVHLDPYDNEDGIRFLRNQVDNLRVEFQRGQRESNVQQNSQQKRYQVASQMLKAIENQNTELFDVSMYTTVRGPDEDTVKNAWKAVKPDLTQSPAQTEQVRASYVQDEARKTTSPIAKDFLGYDRQMLGGAVAGMLPMTSKTMLEEGGVNLGLHGVNGSPIFVDRFDREGGFNQLTVGAIGSGKSFSTKLNILREYCARDDLTVIILDPLEGFVNFVEKLGGQRVVVGGSQAVNPMELRQADVEDARDAMKEDENSREVDEKKDPFAQKIAQVEGFFRSFFRQEGIELGGKLPTLRGAVILTYKDAGITSDISTHGKESPTVSDLLETLQELSQDPSRLVYEDVEDEDSQTESDIVKQHANTLLSDLRAFQENGKYDMLAQQTEVDLMSSDIVYLDMAANEMDTDHQGLMMQLLFDAVYQRGKETDDKVIFSIDEAHVMMQDEDSLDMLETAVRHSRHYDMSINFITQEVDDFFKSEQSAAIANNCTLKEIHRVEGMSDAAAKGIGLNRGQRQSTRSLLSGKQDKKTVLGGYGFSEALLYVEPEGWFPINVVPSMPEVELVDGDTTNTQRLLQRLREMDRTVS